MATKNRRRLGDLYVVGKHVVFDDGEGDPITVFVRKLNPIEREKALKRANAVRAAMIAAYKDPTSDFSVELESDMQDLSREDLVQILMEEERVTRYPIIEAQVKDRDEWKDEEYLEGILDAWSDGLSDEYAKDPEHEEAKRVHDEMQRLISDVDKEVDAWLESYERDMEEVSDDNLRERAKKSRISLNTNSAWFSEFRRCELWLCVKEEDKRTPYFESREEIDDLPMEVMAELVQAYKSLMMDPLEGKDSGAQDDS